MRCMLDALPRDNICFKLRCRILTLKTGKLRGGPEG